MLKVLRLNPLRNLRNISHFRYYSKPSNNDLIRIFDDNKSWYTCISNEDLGLFSRLQLLKPDGFESWCYTTIEQANILVDKIVNLKDEKDALLIVKRLDRLSDLLCSIIDLAEFIRSNHPNMNMVNSANETCFVMVNYMNQLNTNPGLYLALKKVLEDKSITDKFDSQELQVAILFLKDFEKSGIHLDQYKRDQFVQLNDEINTLGRKFLENTQPSESAISVSKVDLEGCETWLNGTQPIQLIPTTQGYSNMLLRTAKNSEVRKRMFIAANTPSDNQVGTLDSLLTTRLELANLLGYNDFASLHLNDKLVKNPKNINVFLDTLTNSLKPKVKYEMDILNQLKSKYNNGPIMAWDQAYYTHQYELLNRKNHQHINEYFSVGTVISGISKLLNKLYNIYFEPVTTVSKSEIWHDSVRKLLVKDSHTNQTIGVIYMDLYSRPNKPQNAAHYTVQCSRRLDFDKLDLDVKFENYPPESTISKNEDNTFQLPVVVLSTCFNHPSSIIPSLLEPSEVETLFHEMGHAIHSMLARTEYHNVAGTRCKLDFVELPSILMETFALNPKFTLEYAKHYDTKESIPLELINNYINQPNLKALENQHQILLSMIDLKYHSIEDIKPRFSLNMAYDIINNYNTTPAVENTNIAFKFGHLFSYSATYYSYLLGRVLASQIFRHGFIDNDPSYSGEVIKNELLRWGGAKDPWICIQMCLEKLIDKKDTKTLKELELLNNPDLAMQLIGRWGLPK